ncbi:MAG: hypothetical protein K1X78_07875 [Verrucomicrobiaceae bacterium]|nr:hypothetical protein [Verrucomicrobiaceae bacterium]
MLGSLTGKDASVVQQEQRPVAKRWILTGFRSHRAVPTTTVWGKLSQIEPHAEVHEAERIADALEIAVRFPERRLITGSLYFAGEVLAHRHAVACEVSDQ